MKQDRHFKWRSLYLKARYKAAEYRQNINGVKK